MEAARRIPEHVEERGAEGEGVKKGRLSCENPAERVTIRRGAILPRHHRNIGRPVTWSLRDTDVSMQILSIFGLYWEKTDNYSGTMCEVPRLFLSPFRAGRSHLITARAALTERVNEK